MADLEFRDGVQSVPDYLAELMIGLPLHTITKDEAIAAVNNRLMGDHLRKAQDRLIANHFQSLRRGE
jgi:hypothetical protein